MDEAGSTSARSSGFSAYANSIWPLNVHAFTLEMIKTQAYRSFESLKDFN